MIRLLGIVLLVVGFALRWNTMAVALGAALVTALLAGITLPEVVTLLGSLFVDNRALTLPVVLMVPVVGVLERHGLQQRVGELMRRAGGASAGRVLGLYQALRGLTSMFGLQLGNHASLVRPLVAPMAQTAAGLPPDSAQSDPRAARIRAHAAAAENVGNFFSDDIVVAIGALLLIRATMEAAGVPVALGDLQRWNLPTALAVLVIGGWRYRSLNRRLHEQPPRSPASPP
jgi:uncharacterized membrane protein